jgi:outer membrane protein assembly factor BamD
MRLILSAFLLASLVACSKKEPDSYVEAPVEQLYNDATDAMTDGRFAAAGKLFDEVERQHPYSIWATKAQLMSAFAQYSLGKYDEAIGTADRFIALHPGNRDVAYAYYMRSLSYYEQITDVRRDQRITSDAMKALDEVIRRFPDSNYARDARIKLDLTKDHLAGKEMDIGRYYQKQGQFTAAIGRFRRVVDEYQTTSHVPEALHRLTEAYLAVGIREEAEKVAAVLGHNYPGSEWYADSYALLKGGERPGRENQGFLGRTFGKLF